MRRSTSDYESLRPYASTRQREILDALQSANTFRAAADALGVSERNLFATLRRLRISAEQQARAGHAPGHFDAGVAPGYKMGKVTVQRDADGAVERTWERQSPDADAVREWLEGFTDRLVERVDGLAKPSRSSIVCDSALMSAYVVGDAHIGAYAHGAETGCEDFDTDIATSDVRGAFRYLTGAAARSRVGLLVNVGDVLHANDTTAQTPSSKHLLDTDGRYAQVIDRAVAVFCDAIEMMLKRHHEVWVINARGNHDPDAAIWLNKVLEAYYRREPRVRIRDNTPKFQYVAWGKVLIGVHHGDRVKRQQLYEAMTRDQREAWGKAVKSYFWTGHIHHKAAEEIGGCLFESFNTLAAPDAWHAALGYGAGREMQQITLHADYGIVGRNVCSVEMARLAA